MALSHSKFKKRIKKRNLSFSSNGSGYNCSISNQPVEQEEPPFHPIPQLDLMISTIFSLTSQRGHYTYYSKVPISSGDYFFETQITDLSFDILSYIKSKCVDEIKKKYYEPLFSNIKNYQPTVRIGILDTKGELDVPIGALANSYGYRSSDGALIGEGEYIYGNKEFKEGDVVGCLIHLKPPKPEFLKMEEDNIISDESYLKFYINGVEQQEILKITEGNYYLGVTLFNHAQADVNFGKNVQYFPNGFEKGIKFLCDE